MGRYILKRVGFLLLTLVLTSVLVFIIAQVIPGDVCRVILGRDAGGLVLERCAEELGLNKPNIVRYAEWLIGFFTGDWGTSYATDQAIFPWVMGRLRNSLMLAGVTVVFALPLSIFLGVIAGINEGKWVDNLISISVLSVVGLPEFVTGIILIQFVGQKVPWIPSSSSISVDMPFIEAFPSLILPALTATFVLLAYVVRLMRAGIIEELKRDYVRTAELKGLSRRTVMLKHVLRNALLPTITVIENVFNYPGLGRLMLFAIDRRDLPLLQATVMITVVVFVISNLIADLLYAVLNPRIRVG